MQKHIGVRYIYEDQAQADTLAIEDLGRSEISPSAFRELSTSLIAYLTADVANFELDLIANLIKENHYDDAALASAIKRYINDWEAQKFFPRWQPENNLKSHK